MNREALLASAMAAGLPATSRIVAGMASVRGNDVALVEAVRSLRPQVDEVHLYLNRYDEAPAALRGDPGIVMTFDPAGTALGDAGKFVGLASCGDDVVYLTCDDDIRYPSDYVERMVGALAAWKGRAAVGVHGVLLLQPFDGYYAADARVVLHFEQEQVVGRAAHVLGTGTVAFHTAHVRPPLSVFEAPNMADVWFALHARRTRTPLWVVDRPEKWLVELKGGRPTIFDESSHVSGSGFDTGRRQSEVLRAMQPLSVLYTHPEPARCPVFLVKAETVHRLEDLLVNLARRSPDAVLIVLNAARDPAVARTALRWSYRREVHLVDADAPGTAAAQLAGLVVSARPPLSGCALVPEGDGAVVRPLEPVPLLLALAGRSDRGRPSRP